MSARTHGASGDPRWDGERYTDLQDRAWELEALARDQAGVARGVGARAEADATRDLACGLRGEAARLLATYWDVR